jgi:hypothetical protein
MSDPTDSLKPSDLSNHVDELLATIRAALAQDAAAEVRSAGTLACRAILRALDPAARTSTPVVSSPPSSATAFPASSLISSVLATINTIPRDQLLELVGGLRWLFGGQGPIYLSRPTLPPTRPRSAD